MSNELGDWLSQELDQRRLSYRELAKQAGVSSPQISRVITGVSKAGADFCVKVAQALDESPEKLLRLAGYLPPVAPVDNDPTLQELFDMLRKMSPKQRKEVLPYIRFVYQKKG